MKTQSQSGVEETKSDIMEHLNDEQKMELLALQSDYESRKIIGNNYYQ